MAILSWTFFSTILAVLSSSLAVLSICHTENTTDYWNSLQSLVHEFSMVIDLTNPTDKATYDSVKEAFSAALNQYCSCTQEINNSFVCDVIRSSLKLTSRAIKETLAQNSMDDRSPGRTKDHSTAATLSFSDILALVPWNQYLLQTSLNQCLFDINEASCPGDLTPLEYAVKLHQFQSALVLMEKGSVVLPGVIQLAIACQEEEFLQVIVWKQQQTLNDQPTTLDNSMNELASLYCWMGEWGCHICDILRAISQNVNEPCTGHLPQWIASAHSAVINLHGYSSISDRFHLTVSSIAIKGRWDHISTGGWLVYEDNPLLGTSACHVPVIDTRQMSMSTFEELLSLRIPFLLTAIPYFPDLVTLWSKHSLIELFSNVDLLAGPIPYGELFGETFGVASVAEFLHYMDVYSLSPVHFNNEDTSVQLPLYVFDGQVINEIFQPFFKLPELYSSWNGSEFYHQFILGPRGSGAPFHFHCSAMNYLAYGRKKWFLYPPGKSIYSKTHPLHWYRTTYKILSLKEKPIECLQKKNEMMFVPSGWSHSTLNIDECVGMATEFNTNDC